MKAVASARFWICTMGGMAGNLQVSAGDQKGSKALRLCVLFNLDPQQSDFQTRASFSILKPAGLGQLNRTEEAQFSNGGENEIQLTRQERS